MDWKKLLAGRLPRQDLSEPFAAEDVHVEKPALLNSPSVLAAAAVAARLLEIIARRGGTRIEPADAQKLRQLASRVLPDSAIHLCDDEVDRTIQWLTRPEPADACRAQSTHDSPGSKVVLEADTQSRISVVQLAIDEDYDLELEYLDVHQQVWPRIRCTPVALDHAGDAEDILAADHADSSKADSSTLVVDSDFGTLDIPIRHIRWLMPISRHHHRRSDATNQSFGKVLNFPTDRDSDDPPFGNS